MVTTKSPKTTNLASDLEICSGSCYASILKCTRPANLLLRAAKSIDFDFADQLTVVAENEVPAKVTRRPSLHSRKIIDAEAKLRQPDANVTKSVEAWSPDFFEWGSQNLNYNLNFEFSKRPISIIYNYCRIHQCQL
jgi:hypothetical protein